MKRLNLRDDRGIALVTVLGVSLVLSLLVVASTAYAVGSQKNARRDQDWHAALAAAQAGVDEYISRLNRDGNYWRYGNPASPYSAGSAVTLPSPANPAFLGWTDVELSGGRADYRYEVDNRGFLSEGVVKLRSTGRVGKRTRTVEVNVRRRGFIDYLYFTDFETKDPALYVKGDPDDGYDQLSPEEAQEQCALHWYEGRKDQYLDAGGKCVPINFGGRDELNGPMHTNDAFLVCGAPKFNDIASTSWTGNGTRRYRINPYCGAATPTFRFAGDARFQAALDLPPSNSTIKREVDSRYTPTPGCLYVGPTKITLNSNGRMNVENAWTQNGGAAWCGTGSNLPLPANGVIYVANVPSPRDAYTRSGVASACRANGNSIGYPINEDITSYGCRTGDVFIQGSLNGQLTVAAENNVVVTWHLDYANGASGRDILGLVANNYVEVYHPVRCVNPGSAWCNLNANGSSPFRDPRISGALLSVNHSIRVQNYSAGSQLGRLNITGALAQRYRGIVGLINTSGYDKNYVYDPRLRYASPPKFLDPVKSAYGVSLFSEPAPAYRASAP